MVGKIVKAISGFYYIEYDNIVYECRAKGVLKKLNISPLVGDFAEFDIIYGQGISREGTLLDMAVEYGIVEKSGAFFSYHDQRLAQGRDNARKYLKNNPELLAEIDQQVRAKLFAPKELTAEETVAMEEQDREEEDDLALLDEDI